MKKIKKGISLLLCLLMLISLVATSVITVAADTNVYFLNTRKWSKVYAYVWYNGDGGENAAWPGVEATLVGAQDGFGIYTYNAGSYNGIIFNDTGTAKTSDLSVTSLQGKYFEPLTCKIYNSPEAAIAGFRTVQKYDYYVCGAAGLCGSEWQLSDSNCGMTRNDDGSYTKSFQYIAAGYYDFKINTGQWASEGGEEYPSNNYTVHVGVEDSTVIITLTELKNISVQVIPPSASSETSGSTTASTAPTSASTAPSTDATEPGTIYFPACSTACTSLVEGLNSIGVDSSFPYRAHIAITNGIYSYEGSTDQDEHLLKFLKNGLLLDPTKGARYYPACDSGCSTLADALESIGVDSTNSYITKIALTNNINDYTGSVIQDTTMLQLLKSGMLLMPKDADPPVLPTESTAPTSTEPPESSTSTTPTEAPETRYFPACSSSCTSFSEGLKSVGADNSKDSRTKIAAANGISGYVGSADQNSTLLNLLKSGKLVMPEGMTIEPTAPTESSSSQPTESTAPTAHPPIDGTVVYIVNNVGWDNVYVQLWYGGSSKTAELATLIDDENNVYAFDLGDATAVQFSDGRSEQTSKMMAVNAKGKYYSLATDLFFDTLDEAQSRGHGGLIPVAPPEYYFTVTGDKELCASSWDPTDESNILELNESSGLFEKTFRNVPAGTYEFIVTTNGQIGYYDFNLEGVMTGTYDYIILEVPRDGSTVVVGCDAEKAYVSVNGVDIVPDIGGDENTNSYLTYTLLNDGTARITGLVGSIKNLIIPTKIDGFTVTSIGSDAFYYCKSLKSITIPMSMQNIGMYAFTGCTNLEAVYIYDMSSWCNISFGNIYANPLYYARNLYLNSQLVTELAIPDDVRELGPYVFYGCYSLTNVILPESVEDISLMAFWNCVNLNTIVVNNRWCEIYEESNTFPGSAKIYGYNGSTAHIYASNYGRSYVSLDVSICHIWGREKMIDNNCTDDGRTTKMCIICGLVKSEVIKAHGHSYNGGKVTKAATYFATGVKMRTCIHCGEEKAFTIAKKTLAKPTLNLTGGKGKFTVKYTPVKGATGFQIEYKVGKKTVTKTYNTKKKVSKVVSKLKKGTYKVQMRVFAKSGSKKAYSKWTSAKKVKVK